MSRQAVYARYSSHSQDQGTSIDVQVEVCERAAGGACTRYIDRARTGRSVAGRDALRRLLEDAEAGKLDRVWLYKFDRIGRSHETHTIVADLEDFGVEVVSATEGREELSRGIQLVVAQHYSKALAERTRDGLKKRFEQGGWTGGNPPFGYRAENRRIVVDPAESEVVQKIFRLHRTGLGIKSIARRLHERGTSTRSGRPWSPGTIRGILVNPIVTGIVRFNRRRFRLDRRTGRRVPVHREASEHMAVVDETLRILPDEEFQATQQRLAARAKACVSNSGGRRSMHVFSGLVRCGACGEPYYAKKSANTKGTYIYYTCSSKLRHGKGACCAPNLREDHMVAWFQGRVEATLSGADRIIEKAVAELERRMAARRQESQRHRKVVDAADAEIKQLMSRVTDPALDDLPEARTALYERMASAKAEREAAAGEVERAANAMAVSASRIADDVRAALEEARESLADAATPDQLRQVVSEVMGVIQVAPSGDLRPLGPAKELKRSIVCAQHKSGEYVACQNFRITAPQHAVSCVSDTAGFMALAIFVATPLNVARGLR